MTALAEVQADFIALLLDDDLPRPAGWSARMAAGLEIYRNNYRTALIEALHDSFARTARWVGEETFARAAAHHLVLYPPTSWTLDRAGLGFDQTLADLFTGDPEVGELAWAEWAMLTAFGARDAVPLSAMDFAAQSAGFDENGWEDLRLHFMPGVATRLITQDLPAIWRQLEGIAETEPFAPSDAPLAAPLACHIYREGEKPVFVTAPAHEAAALTAMLAGESFGAACEMLAELLDPDVAAPEAGAMLGRWLHLGLIEQIAAR